MKKGAREGLKMKGRKGCREERYQKGGLCPIDETGGNGRLGKEGKKAGGWRNMKERMHLAKN